MRYAIRLLALAGTTAFVLFSLNLAVVKIIYYLKADSYFGRFPIQELMHDIDLTILVIATAASIGLGFLYRRLARPAH